MFGFVGDTWFHREMYQGIGGFPVYCRGSNLLLRLHRVSLSHGILNIESIGKYSTVP